MLTQTGSERLIWAQGSPATLKAVSTTIKGVRINLAAAICWENYMPLLRQALYAQNINLYLAPTADARDAWMSLMRTVALEGRCFVVSSNMCVHEDEGGPAASSTGENETIDTNGQQQQQQQQGMTDGPPGGVRDRGNSCFTEEGFEIALPPSPTEGKKGMSGSGSGSRGRGGGRRNSVFDEDGHEIVLPSELKSAAATTTASATVGADVSSSAVVEENHEEDETTTTTTTTTTDKAEYAPRNTNTTTQGKGKSSFASRGGSSIVSPFGDVLAGPQWEEDDGIIYADVDFDDCIRGRLDLDAAGSYSRNDSFKFSVEGLDLDPLPYS
ncbi:Uu.00g064380.m01.CDS01 [Anthostomella pinea]|uniref:Uu.00g064380.m01.CDS01 n=1 Tax=Anthostomella pinea TaxID=933095 RepID=A0AAI8VUS6_9PEZI|nr:Uu.00g064380.m01.CDS01 [Anthostomella pinea]